MHSALYLPKPSAQLPPLISTLIYLPVSGGMCLENTPSCNQCLHWNTLKCIEIDWIYGLWMFIYVYGFRLHRVLHQRERKTPQRKFQKISCKLVLIWLFHEIDNPNYGKFSTTLVRHCPWSADMVKLHKISLFHGNRGFPIDFYFGLPLRDITWSTTTSPWWLVKAFQRTPY